MDESLAPMTPVIQCQNVYKIFGLSGKRIVEEYDGKITLEDTTKLRESGHVVAVNNATFKVYQNEILVIMGLSGSGKSTLVRCLSRLTDTTSGSIYIEGEDLLAMKEKQLIEMRRHKMGMVFQNFALLPHKTVLQNIIFPLQMRGENLQESITRAREMIELVGLTGRENSFPRELSGGQQQRVGIARSLAVEPDIWFLDEPFSALDPLIRKEMQDEFLRLQSLLNKTIVFITHDFDEALRLADRIAIMYHGDIVQIDTPANIVLHPATDYVKKFTNEVPRAKILTAQTIMDPVPEKKRLSSSSVQTDSILETIASQILSSSFPTPVINNEKHTVGVISRQKVIDMLYRI